MNKKKSFSLHKLFWNDRFLIIFSIVIAVIFWAAVCVSFSPETTNVIKDVPVIINEEGSVPSQCGLQVFGEENFTVDITVRGSRYVVGENLLKKEDFKVSAVTSSVTTSGTHSLQIRVAKINEKADFEIESISESFVSVYFDFYDKKEIPVTIQLNKKDFVKPGYTTDDHYIMEDSDKNVIVSGPALEIAQLDSVVADVQIPGDDLTKTTLCSASLTAYTKNKTALKYVSINGEENARVNITIPVYKMENHPLDVDFTNVPSAYKSDLDSFIKYSFTPHTLNAAVLQNGSQIENISVGKIDFSKIKSGENVFQFSVDSIKKIKTDSTKEDYVTVKFNVNNVSSKFIKLNADNILVDNAPDDTELDFLENQILVQVFGSEKELNSLNSENLNAKIDWKNMNVSGDKGVYEGPVYIENADECWIYGTYNLSYELTD